MFDQIKTAALTPVAFVIFAKEEFAARKAAERLHIEEQTYNAMIAESQAKIGQYKPAAIPVQIWA